MAASPELEVVSSLTQPGASVGSAVQKLVDLTAAAAATPGGSDPTGDSALATHVYNVWTALVENVVANTHSAEQTRLVEFVRCLRMQKVINPTTNDQLLFKLVADYTIPVWTGLPMFGIIVRDEWEFDASSCTPEEETRYYNKLTFLAKLTCLPENNEPEDPERSLPPYDFSLYALWDLRAAFEEEVKSDSTRAILLRGASLWMVHCAEKLWANVRAERSYVHQASGTNPARAGECFDKAWTGFNKERWFIWVNGFKSVDGIGGEEVQGLVGKALNEMVRLEGSA